MSKRCKECERDGRLLNEEGHCRQCQEEIDHPTSSTLKITEEHIECALKNLGNISNRRAERWTIVKELFGIGSSRSTKLCQMYNIDPFEVIGEDKCNNCELTEEE